MRAALWVVLAVAAAAGVSCGKIGPPLPPLRLVPEAPAGLTAVRVGPDVHLRFTVPAQNAGQPGPVEIERVEIYAASVAPGAPAPPNREFLTEKYLVGSVDVRPGLPAEAPPAAPEAAAAETRPGPGEPASFVEPLTAEMLNPAAPPQPPQAPPVDPQVAAKTPPPPTYATRIYAVRGVTSRGRPGNPSARVAVPLVEPPAPPRDLAVDFTDTTFSLTWTPPLAEIGGAPLLFAVYRAESPAAAALTPKPVAEPAAQLPGVEFGVERCFVVRTRQQVAKVDIESEASAPACVTPRDIFPPAAPSGLTGVATPGAIALLWDPNTEPDLAGYLVLRGEAGSDTLQPLTPEPIGDASYTDTSVTPGVRYAYVVVAVDRATPPNRSAPSARHEVTAAQ